MKYTLMKMSGLDNVGKRARQQDILQESESVTMKQRHRKSNCLP